MKKSVLTLLVSAFVAGLTAFSVVKACTPKLISEEGAVLAADGSAYRTVNLSETEYPDFTYAAESAVDAVVYVKVTIKTKMNSYADPFYRFFFGEDMVIFRNSFNGKYQLSAAITPLRVVCQNQFNFAFNHVANTINIRHSARVNERMEDAKIVLKGVANYMGKLNEIAKQFAGIKLSNSETELALNMMFPTPANADIRAKQVIANQKSAFANMLDANDNQNHKGNAWGLVNAYTDYITHTSIRKGRYDDSQFMNTCFKPMNNIIDIVSTIKYVNVA